MAEPTGAVGADGAFWYHPEVQPGLGVPVVGDVPLAPPLEDEQALRCVTCRHEWHAKPLSACPHCIMILDAHRPPVVDVAVDWEHLADKDWLSDDDPRRYLINWVDFWAQDYADEQWLAWPLIAKSRQTVIYAPAKAGKSLLILDVVAAMATGAAILGNPNAVGPIDVLYLDYEMTPADLYERLDEMGYGPESDLSHLHYASLPILPPLNRPEGAKAVLELARLTGAQLVVVDTLSRAVEGDENDADTINEFYRWTGLALKADGIALLRVDHAGKDIAKGQRGSSAKAADIDVVWQLTRVDDALAIKRTHTRVGWVPELVAVTIHNDPLRHKVEQRGFVAGSSECVALLKSLGAAPGISSRHAQELLKGAGKPRGRRIVLDACRHLRDEHGLEALVNQNPRREMTVTDSVPGGSGTTGAGSNGDQRRNQRPETVDDQARNHRGTTGNHRIRSGGEVGSDVVRTTEPRPEPAVVEWDF